VGKEKGGGRWSKGAPKVAGKTSKNVHYGKDARGRNGRIRAEAERIWEGAGVAKRRNTVKEKVLARNKHVTQQELKKKTKED